MSDLTADDSADLDALKQQSLLTFHRVFWEEMTWRRNAGYRTVILGMAYCGVLIALVTFNRQMLWPVRACMSAVIALATAFGAGYLSSNYKKYMAAAARMVLIEEYLGTFDSDYLGRLGPLMLADRKARPTIPLSKNPVCLWSILAFAAAGLTTAVAILLV